MDEDTVARELDAGVVVDGEVAERVRARAAGTGERRERGDDEQGRDEHAPPHLSASRATGAHRTENSGLSASALRVPRAHRSAVTGAAGGVAAVEAEQRILRPEAERPLEPALRLGAASGARERPPEGVVAVDRGPVGRARRASATVSAGRIPWSARIDRGLEVDAEAVRGEQPVDRGDRRLLPAAAAAFAAAARAGRRAARRTAAAGRRSRMPGEPADRGAEPAARGLDARLLLERGHVPGEDRQRSADVLGGRATRPAPSSSLPSSTCVQAVGSGCTRGGVERELHRGDRTRAVAGQLAGVRDAGVRGEVRLERDHPLEGRERRRA